MLLARASSRRADDHRVGRRYRHQQPRRHVSCEIIQELARKHALPTFRVGWFHSDVPRVELDARLGAARSSQASTIVRHSTRHELDATDRIVAMAGVHPYIALLRRAPTSSSAAAAATAPSSPRRPSATGYPEALAYYYGKVLECASFCAEPYGGKESILGEITMDDVKVTAMLPAQRCTIASVAGHAMYERANPFHEYVARRPAGHERLRLRTVR